jgi:hypothetical protein
MGDLIADLINNFGTGNEDDSKGFLLVETIIHMGLSNQVEQK